MAKRGRRSRAIALPRNSRRSWKITWRSVTPGGNRHERADREEVRALRRRGRCAVARAGAGADETAEARVAARRGWPEHPRRMEVPQLLSHDELRQRRRA